MEAVRSTFRKLLSGDREPVETCPHLEEIRDVTPSSEGCEECLALGDEWVHLRMCMICGHVGCCDSSKNKHATKHYHATGHPIMRSFEPRETWMWCFVDNLLIHTRRRR